MNNSNVLDSSLFSAREDVNVNRYVSTFGGSGIIGTRSQLIYVIASVLLMWFACLVENCDLSGHRIQWRDSKPSDKYCN